MARGREATRSTYAEQAAAMIKVSRFRTQSVGVFANRLGRELGWGPLSRQAIYDWEAGRSRVPAVAIFAAARVVDLPIAELIALADRFRCTGREDVTSAPVEQERPAVRERSVLSTDRVKARLTRPISPQGLGGRSWP